MTKIITIVNQKGCVSNELKARLASGKVSYR
jgi:hypothetical protein